MTRIDDLLDEGRQLFTANRVFGQPYEKNGVTVITAASVRGGLGGGEGDQGEGQPTGGGGGMGMTARPVGAFLVKGNEVSWIPAADTTRVILASQLLVLVGLLVIRSIVKLRRPR